MDIITTYNELIEQLERKLFESSEEAQSDTNEDSLSGIFSDVLAQRDVIEKVLNSKAPDKPLSQENDKIAEDLDTRLSRQVDKIVELDKKLYELGRCAINPKCNRKTVNETVDLESWRSVMGKDQTSAWWWNLDTVPGPYAVPHRPFYAIFDIILILLSLVVLYFTLPLIFQETEQVARLILDLFRSADLANVDLDVYITMAAILFNILFSGRIAFELASRLSRYANNLVKVNLPILLEKQTRVSQKIAKPLSHALRSWFHVNAFSVGLVVFVAVTLVLAVFVDITLNTVVDNFAETAVDRDERLAILQVADLLNETSSDELSIEYTIAALEYEQLGNNEQAMALYESVLNRNAEIYLARYRFADMLIDEGETERAITLLDDGIRELTTQIESGELPSEREDEAAEDDGATRDEDEDTPISIEDAKQLQVLMLISRGRALLTMGEYDAALVDLRRTERIVTDEDNAHLFVTRPDESNVDEIRTVAIYAYSGQANRAIIEERDSALAVFDACNAWARVQELGQINIIEERLWLFEADRFMRQNECGS